MDYLVALIYRLIIYRYFTSKSRLSFVKWFMHVRTFVLNDLRVQLAQQMYRLKTATRSNQRQ